MSRLNYGALWCKYVLLWLATVASASLCEINYTMHTGRCNSSLTLAQESQTWSHSLSFYVYLSCSKSLDIMLRVTQNPLSRFTSTFIISLLDISTWWRVQQVTSSQLTSTAVTNWLNLTEHSTWSLISLRLCTLHAMLPSLSRETLSPIHTYNGILSCV